MRRFSSDSMFASMRSICESADEHHAVDALQDQLAAGVVEHLAGHGVEVEARLEAADLAERQRQEVEEQRALGLGRERDHLALRLGVGLVVDVLQVGRLPAQAGPVVDDLAVDLARRVVDEAHRASSLPPQSLNRLSMSLVGDLGEDRRLALAAALLDDAVEHADAARRTPSSRAGAPARATIARRTARPGSTRCPRARCGRWSSRPRGTGWRIPSRARSLAMPPVAATLPAVSDDSDVTSSSSTSPASAIGWPSRR